MRKNTLGAMVLALGLGLPLTACQDTKTLKENEQLKAHAAELEKSNADLENRIDGLTKENAALAADNEKLKQKAAPKKKATKTKRRRKRTTS